MSAREMKIVGALGPGQLAPLLLEDEGRLFVASLPAPAALTRCRSVHVVAATRPLKLGERELGLAPYVEGQDLDELLTQGPLEDPQAILSQVLAALRAARGVGVRHGALRNACVRVGPSGVVRVVGWRDGKRDDLERLRELVTEWTDEPEPLLEQLTGELEVSEPAPAPVVPHPLTGETVKIGGASAPPRLRVASIAALTLLLGLGSGVILSATPSAAPTEIVVEGADDVVAECGEMTLRTTSDSLRLPAGPLTCTIWATSTEGASVRGRLRVSLPGMYRCREQEGELTCSAP